MRVADPTVRFATRQAERKKIKMRPVNSLWNSPLKELFSAHVSADLTSTCFAQRDAYTRFAEEKLEISDIRDNDVFRNNMETLCV